MSYVSQCVTTDAALGLFALGENPINTGSTVAVDQAGISNGTYDSGTWTGGQTSFSNAGFTAATSTAGRITVPRVGGNTIGGNLSWETWIKTSSNPAGTRGIGGWSSAGCNILIRWTAGGGFQVTAQAIADLVVSSSSIPTDSAWHHIAFTTANGSASTNKLYLDGVDVSSSTSSQSIGAANGDYLFGGDNTDTNASATFAMWGFYNSQLSASAIANHYSIGAATIFAKSFSVRTG
jgi:hypothetical protein